MDFLIRQIDNQFAYEEINRIGFDSDYISSACKKYDYRLFKIFNLAPHQATIIKQTALSIGTDAAVHRDVLLCKINSSNLLVGGSVSQLLKLCEKLKNQPFSLSKLSDSLFHQLKPELIPIKIRNTLFDWNKKTYIMGILNVTPDSFSDGGKYFDKNNALKRAIELSQSSDLIDIGAESTKPFSSPVSVEEEIKRIIPVIKSVREENSDIPISVDTRNSKTAKAAIEAGADMINDVSGLAHDDKMGAIAAEYGVPIVIMHSCSDINMQNIPEYKDGVADEVYKYLFNKIDYAISCGIEKKNIVIDVGIGFDKTFEDNIELISRMDEFFSLGCPILAGVSRKSVIKQFSGEDICMRDEGTLAVSAYLASKKINILRVHNTLIHKKSIELIDELVRR